MWMFAFIFFISTTFAILSPLYQGAREVKEMLSDPRMSWLGSEQRISEIIYGDQSYVIITQEYSMQVDVGYESKGQRWAGPGNLLLHFHRPIHRQTGEVKIDRDSSIPAQGSENFR